VIGEILLIILAFGLLLSGAVGVLLPLLPGVPIAWLGMLVFGYATGFAEVTWKILLVFLGLTALTFLIDIAAPLIGAKKYHVSRSGMIGSAIGLLFGIFIGPAGIVIGPFLGALAGELWSGKELEQAAQSAKGAVIGFLAGSAIKLAVILVMLGWLISALL